MSQEVLIKVEGVSKKFCRRLKRSLMYGVQDIGTELLGRAKKPELRKHEFWAVDDVSFELKRGECLGLIGRNGAGKSTLLKMLNGLIKPDTGRIAMKGRIGALIELGTGFNPILTGRENIYNNGAVLGFSKKEMDTLFEEIVEFSELADFIDTPLQNYSSGMKVRLGFSVAVHLKPDILILDEVLAVGDSGFKMKSLNKMYEMISKAAVIFVNHSAIHISRVSTKILFMKNGAVNYFGDDILKGIEMHQDQFEGEKRFIEFNEHAQIDSISFSSGQHASGVKPDLHYVNYGDYLHIDIIHSVSAEFIDYQIGIAFTNKDMVAVASTRSEIIKNNGQPIKKARISLPEVLFTNGEYSCSFTISKTYQDTDNQIKKKVLANYRHWAKFYVVSNKSFDSVSLHLACNTSVIE